MTIIFITYIDRSGSTFFSNLFSKYENILVFPEAHILKEKLLTEPFSNFTKNQLLQKELQGYFKTDPKLKYWHLDPQEVFSSNPEKNIDAFIAILDAYRIANKPGASIYVFKNNSLFKPFVALKNRVDITFDLSLIALIRDARAIYSSQKKTIHPVHKKAMCSDPFYLARTWNVYTNAIVSLSGTPGFFTIDYELLINNCDVEFEKILQLLKIQDMCQKGEYDLFDRIPPNQQKIHLSILKPPDTAKIYNWKSDLKKFEIHIIEKTARENLIRFGYKLLNTKQNNLFFLLFKIYYKFRDTLFHLRSKF